MPVPQTLTLGALGLATKWSASSMQTLRLPWPAPSPRTAAFSMYAFWLMSSLVFFTRTAEEQQNSDAKMKAAALIIQTTGPQISPSWRAKSAPMWA